MSQKKDTLKEIRSGLLSRGLSLAKAGLRAGNLAASHFRNQDPNKPAWLGKVEYLVKELGELKGTAMKVGQTISMYGEHLLPKEVNELLKKLQQDSPALAWEAIRARLIEQLGEEKFNELEVEHNAIACASIGQVHKATIKSTGEVIALKIQYPGVDSAVETDLKLLKFILNMTELVPRGPRFDQIFAEIKEMFHQEIDYELERDFGSKFAELLKDDERFIVPEVHPRYCTKKVLAMEFVEGLRADHPDVQALLQDRRDRIGLMFLDLYLRELLEFRLVQTDPHLGNYMIQIDPNGARDKLILLDFGAAREAPLDFLEGYRNLIEGGVLKDSRLIENGGRHLGLLQPQDSIELVDDYIDLCCLLTEPVRGMYDWGKSDLPKRVTKRVGHFMTAYRLRAPPRELVFLDRKLGGVFIFLSVMKCVVDTREIVLNRLKATSRSHFSPDRE